MDHNQIFINVIKDKYKSDIIRIDIDNILFIKSEKDYCYIYTSKDIYKCHFKLKKLIKHLSDNFMQCHKQFIININKIDKISVVNRKIYISANIIPIGRLLGNTILEKINYINYYS